MGFDQVSEKTKKKGATKKDPPGKPQANMKKHAAGGPCKKAASSSGDRKPWYKLTITRANKPVPRTYILGTTDPKDKKGKLVVEISSKRTGQHREFIEKIYKELEEKQLTKEEALALRDQLCWEPWQKTMKPVFAWSWQKTIDSILVLPKYHMECFWVLSKDHVECIWVLLKDHMKCIWVLPKDLLVFLTALGKRACTVYPPLPKGLRVEVPTFFEWVENCWTGFGKGLFKKCCKQVFYV